MNERHGKSAVKVLTHVSVRPPLYEWAHERAHTPNYDCATLIGWARHRESLQCAQFVCVYILNFKTDNSHRFGTEQTRIQLRLFLDNSIFLFIRAGFRRLLMSLSVREAASALNLRSTSKLFRSGGRRRHRVNSVRPTFTSTSTQVIWIAVESLHRRRALFFVLVVSLCVAGHERH